MEIFQTKKSDQYNEAVRKYIPCGMHSNYQYIGKKKTIHFIKGCRSRLWDMDGNEYLDLYCRSGANILGHSHPIYTDTLQKAILGPNATELSDVEFDLCKSLAACIPSAEMIRFSLSGTEAIQNALRLARAYTGRNRFLRFTGNYHGNADNILGGKIDNIDYPIPTCEDPYNQTLGRATGSLSEQSFLIPWNNFEILENTIRKLHSEIACIITEPISINGGGILPKPGYLSFMRKLCNDFGIVLIFDEVITGFRVALNGAQGKYGVTPDVSVFGKALGGGALPIAAIVGKKEIMKLYENRSVVHGGTFNGYRLGLIAANCTVNILRENETILYKRMYDIGNKISSIFLEEAAKVNIKINLHGLGPCFVFDCRDSDGVLLYENLRIATLVEAILSQALLEHGILLTNGNRLYTNISLTDDDIYMFQTRIRPALKNTSDLLKTMKII